MGCGASSGVLPAPLPHTSQLLQMRNVKHEYELGSILGDGAHSKVWNGCHKATKEEVAIKEMKTVVQENCNFHEELRILEVVKGHEHVVGLLAAFSNGTRGWLIMPIIKGGDIQSFFFEKEAVIDEELEACVAEVMGGVFSALEHCHRLKVAHLDVKPENVLLLSAERPLHVLLTDFGSARGFLDPETSNYKEHVDIVGTPCYVAPDVVRKKYHPPQADMWSAGMTMLTLLSGELLFDSPLTDVILHRVSTTKIVLPPIVTKKTSTACRNLLQRLLRRRGCDRPSSQAACAHPWIVTRGKHTDDMDVPLPDEPEGEPTTGVAHIPSKKAPSPKPLRNREEHETGANTPEDSNQGKVTTTTTNTTTVTTASTSTANGATTTLPAPGAGAPSATTAAIKPVYAKDHAEYFLF